MGVREQSQRRRQTRELLLGIVHNEGGPLAKVACTLALEPLVAEEDNRFVVDVAFTTEEG